MINIALSPELNEVIYRKRCKEQLQDMPSKELEELVKDIFKKKEGQKIDRFYLAFAGPNDDLFVASGACDVLRERHGDDYTARLAGLRKPRTVGEMLKYWITGKMPKYEK